MTIESKKAAAKRLIELVNMPQQTRRELIEQIELTKPVKVAQLAEDFLECLEALEFYADPEKWMKKGKDSWTDSCPKSFGDNEMIQDYKHPGRDWTGTVVVGGKKARQTLKKLGAG